MIPAIPKDGNDLVDETVDAGDEEVDGDRVCDRVDVARKNLLDRVAKLKYVEHVLVVFSFKFFNLPS
jgi:hypothetical protein